MSEKTLMTESRRRIAFSAVKTPSSCRSLILLRSETARLNVAARRGGTGAKSKRSHARRRESFESFASGKVFVAPSSGKTKVAPASSTATRRAEKTRPARFVHISAAATAADKRHATNKALFISCRPHGRSPTPPRHCAAHRLSAHARCHRISRNPPPHSRSSTSEPAPRRHPLRAFR